MKKLNKRIVIYAANDELFTIPLIKKICEDFSQFFLIDIFLSKASFKRRLKILIVFILFGSLFRLINLFKNKITLNDLVKIKNVNIINNIKKKYYFGISLNYPKKITLKNFDIFNFHLGNFSKQRGSFIFFYKHSYKWSNLDLTFHKISNRYDCGKIFNTKKINIIKKNATDICLLYNNNYMFIKKCINEIKIKKNNKFILGKLNTEPSFYLIIKIYIFSLLKN